MPVCELVLVGHLFLRDRAHGGDDGSPQQLIPPRRQGAAGSRGSFSAVETRLLQGQLPFSCCLHHAEAVFNRVEEWRPRWELDDLLVCGHRHQLFDVPMTRRIVHHDFDVIIFTDDGAQALHEVDELLPVHSALHYLVVQHAVCVLVRDGGDDGRVRPLGAAHGADGPLADSCAASGPHGVQVVPRLVDVYHLRPGVQLHPPVGVRASRSLDFS